MKVVCETPDVVVGEYEFNTKSSKTGRVIHQLFVGRLEAENGKIKLLRESINLVEVGLAIYANGLADYKMPKEHRSRPYWSQAPYRVALSVFVSQLKVYTAAYYDRDVIRHKGPCKIAHLASADFPSGSTSKC